MLQVNKSSGEIGENFKPNTNRLEPGQRGKIPLKSISEAAFNTILKDTDLY